MSKKTVMSCESNWHSRLGVRIAAIGLCAALWPATQSFAQSQPGPGQSEKKTATAAAGAADKSYAAGAKAFESGKHKTAVSSLSAALRQGGLAPDKMAKALYMRGIAYRKQGKPAQAISDLTSAIWIKGGLSDADRLAAMDARNQAYKEAGLGSRAPTGIKPGGSVPSTAQAKPVSVAAAPATTAPPPVATSGGTATSGWSTSAQSQTAVSAPQPAAVATPQASPAPPTSSSPFSSLTPPIAPAPTTAPRLSAVPGASTTPSSTSQTSTGTGAVGSTLNTIGSTVSQGVSNVGSFFSNMFSGGNTAPSATQVTTSSTTPPSTLSTPPSSASQQAPSLGWNATPSPAATRPQTAPAIPQRTAALAKPPPRATTTGKFRLQVAAVRSEQRAQSMVAQLQSKYASDLAGVTPKIDAAAIGNMGTFYRVRLGPYADTKAPQNLCAKLRNDGYDCLIVTP